MILMSVMMSAMMLMVGRVAAGPRREPGLL